MTPANDNEPRVTPPVFTALKRAKDFTTLNSIRRWMRYDAEPTTAANDNGLPEGYQIDSYMESMSAEALIAAYHAGTYHIGMHEERFRRPRGPSTAPPIDEFEDAEGDTARYVDRYGVRGALGENATVLDMACDGRTYREIGEYVCAVGSVDTRERAGKRAVSAAAKLFSEIAA
jgi:hypothetical protein